MKTTGISLVTVWLIAGTVGRGQDSPVLTFDQEKAGSAPAGFVFAAMRQPAPGTWLVRRTATGGHLAHEVDSAASGYALAIHTGASWRDPAMSVRLRLAGGRRTGGLVWHYVDDQHYYAAVLDLSRGELSMYRIAGGNRIRMEFEDDLELDVDAWHTMKVAHNGNSTRVSLGGIRVFEEDHRQDRSVGGRVGFIAAGDAEVWYDDFQVGASRNR